MALTPGIISQNSSFFGLGGDPSQANLSAIANFQLNQENQRRLILNQNSNQFTDSQSVQLDHNLLTGQPYDGPFNQMINAVQGANLHRNNANGYLARNLELVNLSP